MKRIKINNLEVELSNLKQSTSEISFMYLNKSYSFKLRQSFENELVIENQSGQCFKLPINHDALTSVTDIFLNQHEFKFFDSAAMGSDAVLEGSLVSPMPGKVFKIIKKLGDKLKKGEVILILEAMKMEHAIKSDKDGVLKKIFYAEGEMVRAGVSLAEVE